MISQGYTRLFLYIGIPLFIMGWWIFAFKNSYQPETSADFPLELANHEAFSYKTTTLPLSPISRKALHQALQGDFGLMSRLIADWDIEAQLLEEQGFQGVQRLPHENFMRSQLLVKQKNFHISRPTYLVDDKGKIFNLNHVFHRFLPQTQAAASILLALASPEQIVAIPEGMRNQTKLYPASLMEKIPLDIHRFHAERLYLQKPDIAFVAHYSHPATVTALQQQGIHLYTMKNIDHIEDIHEVIGQLGALIHREREAELLKLFVEAAFLSIDNQLLAIRELTSGSPEQILYLNYYSQFSIPTARPLIGQLLERLGILNCQFCHSQYDSAEQWRLPISHEQIINLNPKAIIVSASNPKELHSHISSTALSHLTAVQKNQIYFVEDTAQDSPTHYILLAYYDLFQAIAHILTSSTQALAEEGVAL